MDHKLSQRERIRNIRVSQVRKFVEKGWKMKQLLYYCENNLGVGRVTAVSYIDEAAEPFRKKYETEENNDTT